MMCVPLERAQVLLHKNGEVDPRVAALEVDLYQRNAQKAAVYIGYLNAGHPEIRTFSEAQAATEYVADLKERNEGVEVVIVNGLEQVVT